MRFVTYIDPASGADRAGRVIDSAIHGMEVGSSLLELLGDDGERLAAAGERAQSDPHEVVALADVQLRAPIPAPPTVRDFYAFEQHVKTARKRRGLEMDPDWYELPVFYFSNPYAVNGPNEDVAIAPGSQEMDFELEVAAVVGRSGTNLAPGDAGKYIAGYTIMNDWSARDVQRREMKLSMGPVKGKDFATTLGPLLVTPDELEPFRKNQAYDLAMVARVNGVEYSRSTLASIYYSFEEMVAYASRGTRVGPGDIIGSGTCGTGCILELSLVHGPEQFPWLVAGDQVELEVAQLGILRNRVAAAVPVVALR